MNAFKWGRRQQRPAERLVGLLFAAAWSSYLLSGCQQEQRQIERAKVAELVRAIEVLREAPSDGKRPMLLALRTRACGPQPACEAKALCVKAYARHIEATDGIRAVKRALEKDVGINPQSSVRLLAQSERALAEAAELAKRCAEAQAVLRRRYEL